jgi:pyruvate dehydrogenase E2 component (dihydrolipoamide acetyltransferase)
MSKNLTLPELGEGIHTATVVEIFVKPGDAIAKDQAIMSLETDKAQFELPATAAGTVEKVLVGVGDDVAIGQPVLAIADGGAEDPAPAPETKPAAAAMAVEAKPAPAAKKAPAPRPAPAPAPATPPREAPRADGAVAAAPSVRRLARELGIRLEDVAASTGSARVSAADVEAFKEAGARRPAAEAPVPGLPAPEPLPDFSKWGEIEIEEMSKIRRKTAENMARAWIEIPTVTHHDEADITKLEALRKRYAPRVKEAGGNLTWTAILLNVLAGALKRFPKLNASVDMAQNRVVYKKYVHVGVAVDTERGLLVPVIRDVDKKNIAELAKALAEVSEAARSRNIKPDMMQGATFTITNLGGIGGVGFSPIVNPPQVGILGVSRASTRPVWRDDKFEPRQILPLSLSYDHRVIDGADAARFLRWVCEALEEPFLLDLEGQ